jgi:flagellar export protein FliJ
MADSDIWKLLSGKESGSLDRLRAKLEATVAEQRRLATKIAEIDNYVGEYTDRIRQASAGKADFKVMHHSMNLIAQLTDAKGQLQKVHAELEGSLDGLRQKVLHHEMERLKFNKLGLKQEQRRAASQEKHETAMSDAMALQQFVGARS